MNIRIRQQEESSGGSDQNSYNEILSHQGRVVQLAAEVMKGNSIEKGKGGQIDKHF